MAVNIDTTNAFAAMLMVLELVDGSTLANRLTRGTLPIRDALVIARQIAEALDPAHQTGIVHRDLNPANIVRSSLDACRGRGTAVRSSRPSPGPTPISC
jgi:serine/threonine protein kinase